METCNESAGLLASASAIHPGMPPAHDGGGFFTPSQALLLAHAIALLDDAVGSRLRASTDPEDDRRWAAERYADDLEHEACGMLKGPKAGAARYRDPATGKTWTGQPLHKRRPFRTNPAGLRSRCYAAALANS